MIRTAFALAAALLTFAFAAPAGAQSLAGRWDATVTVKGKAIPFRLQLDQTKAGVKATFFDGDRRANSSSSGSFRNGRLDLDFDLYAGKLDARYEGGVLRGTYKDLRFEARPYRPPVRTPAAPNIAGTWEIALNSPKGEKAWRLIVRQQGGEAFASILRIDGDTGTLNGRYDGTRFRLSRFAGERPGLLEVTPQKDGSLALALFDSDGRTPLKALRPEAARKAGLAPPSDPTTQTGVRDKTEAFRFAGVDLAGKSVTQADKRFKGKVVLLNLMGSWCPNCHDEAPFLAALDARYRAKGLEVVGLDFEQGDQVQSLTRLKAFIKRYGLNYTVLLAGQRLEVREKLPQAVNISAWPTSFFIGRDGRVHSVHVGFPSRGSGPYEVKARADITREIEALLAKKG